MKKRTWYLIIMFVIIMGIGGKLGTVPVSASETISSKKVYYVQFDIGKGTGVIPTTMTCTYGKSYSLPLTYFIRKNYVFNGWSTKKNGRGTKYANGVTIKNLTSTNGKTITLYARWEKLTTDEKNKAKKIIKRTNAQRKKNGLTKVKESTILSSIAMQRAKELSVSFTHGRLGRSEKVFSMMRKLNSGEGYTWVAYENIARKGNTAQAAVKSWMNSSSQREILLNEDVQYIGVGCYRSGGVYYWVQILMYRNE
ncbi:MAG: CAP domain-containing protein [Clostridiales bacterium]|nr:CAP domain-containing protein [Clostridiales bacterium]